MGRITEIIAAVNKEASLNKENFFSLDVENEEIRAEIIAARKKQKQFNKGERK